MYKASASIIRHIIFQQTYFLSREYTLKYQRISKYTNQLYSHLLSSNMYCTSLHMLYFAIPASPQTCEKCIVLHCYYDYNVTRSYEFFNSIIFLDHCCICSLLLIKTSLCATGNQVQHSWIYTSWL